jgi:hypothetical protein
VAIEAVHVVAVINVGTTPNRRRIDVRNLGYSGKSTGSAIDIRRTQTGLRRPMSIMTVALRVGHDVEFGSGM